MMRKILAWTTIGAAVLLGAWITATSVEGGSKKPKGSRHDNGHHNGQNDRKAGVLASIDSMYGVDGPFVGDGFPIRDIDGDELPWEIESAKGTLGTDGRLDLRIKGLVFKDEEGVPEELRGINDEDEFRVLVSCWSENEDEDEVTTVNVISDGFRATRSGNANIRTQLELPNPCVAPVVMVLAGSEDKWFAVSGFEAEEDGD